MELQTVLTYVIVALAALYSAGAIWRQFLTPEDTSTSCACGSKHGCAALSRDMDELFEKLDVLAKQPPA